MIGAQKGCDSDGRHDEQIQIAKGQARTCSNLKEVRSITTAVILSETRRVFAPNGAEGSALKLARHTPGSCHPEAKPKDLLLYFYVAGWNTAPCATALKIGLTITKRLSS
jgi:hypothetical protein